MRILFREARRPARMAKLVRAAFAAEGRPIGLAKARDVTARLYGYATFHELDASCGRAEPSPWDEVAGPEETAARREWQVRSLVADGLSEDAATAFVDANRPTGKGRRPRAEGPALAGETAGAGGDAAGWSVSSLDPPTVTLSERDGGAYADRMIAIAMRRGATDIHVEPRSDGYAVFIRVLRERELIHMGSLDEYEAVVADLKDMARMDRAERRIGQDGGFQVVHEGRNIDLRAATVPAVEGEQVIVRILDPERMRPSLDAIGITEVRSWRRALRRRNGLCLICGETGSGRTTTLNASVRELDRFGKKIYTAEDPVEYRIPYIGSVSTNSTVGYGFAKAIRNFIAAKQPDAIVLGEIRDEETARNAFRAAENGLMVFGTLAATSIRTALQSIQNAGIPTGDLRSVLRSVLVQTLVKVVCEPCGGEGRDGSEVCRTCHGSGYSGLTVVSECASFANPGEVDRALGFAADGRRAEGTVATPWTSILDDAIAKMRAGITTSDALMREYGSGFLDRCAALGVDPELYRLAKLKGQPLVDPPRTLRPVAPRPAIPVALVDDAIARMKAGEVDAATLRRLFGRAFDDRMAALGLDPRAFGPKAA